MKTTILDISKQTGISRFTLAQAARHGLFGQAAHQSGSIWLIDTEHEAFKRWESAHWQQPRVKGEQKRHQ